MVCLNNPKSGQKTDVCGFQRGADGTGPEVPVLTLKFLDGHKRSDNGGIFGIDIVR